MGSTALRRVRSTAAALALGLAAVLALSACGSDDAPDLGEELILATTTSLNDSGLLDELVPIFEAETGLNVKVIAVGTGAALRMGEEGNADALLVHAPDSERELLAAGHAASRELVAYNDFVIVGPAADPAGVSGTSDAPAALSAIAAAGAAFASRGDDSGTHKKELALWAAAGIEPMGDWYLETGQGMSATLTVADQRDTYVLTDRGTYLSLRNRLQLVVAVEGDARLLNYYSVLTVAERTGGINAAGARAWADFIRRPGIQTRIGNYRRQEYGRPLFIPAAADTEQDIAARGGAPQE